VVRRRFKSQRGDQNLCYVGAQRAYHGNVLVAGGEKEARGGDLDLLRGSENPANKGVCIVCVISTKLGGEPENEIH
jgi:hypothetical protein